MCTNKKWIINKYTGHSIFVKCGHCPACQQEKAMRRRAKLKYSLKDGCTILFVTLTYSNNYVPFIKRQDLVKGVNPLPVYRSETACFTKDSFKGSEVSLKRVHKEVELFRFNAFPHFDYLPDFDENGSPLGTYHIEYHDEVFNIPDCKNKPNCISIAYFKDVQNFIKNLRIYSQRKLGIEKPFQSFQVCELGPTTFRAHFHLLLFIEKRYETWFRQAVCRCWPYADYGRTYGNIKEALNAETYVSSYVNRGTKFPSFLALKEIRPRCSFSQGMGLACDAFTLPRLLSAIRERDLRFNKQVIIQGQTSVCRVRIPDYALNRYFPKVKGYSLLSLDSTRVNNEDFIAEPFRFSNFVTDVYLSSNNCSLDYSWEDYDKIQRDLSRCRLRFKRDYYRYFNEWVDDDFYAWWYCQAYLARNMTTLKVWYEQQDSDFNIAQSYDNLDRARISPEFALLLFETGILSLKDNPNNYPNNLLETKYYSDMFEQYQKRKKINNEVFNHHYGDC